MPPKIKINNDYKIAGELRRSQTVMTFGSGSIVDFPRLSGIMSGIDEWDVQNLPEDAKIHERNLQLMLGKEYFYQVSTEQKKSTKSFGLPAFRFPVWYYCPICKRLDYYKKISKQSNNNTNNYNSDLFCNVCSSPKRKVKLIPSRFIVACLNGHIGDFPYEWWVHRDRPNICENPQLVIEFQGNTGGLDSIKVYCKTCGAFTTMSGSMNENALKRLHCKGEMPWLGSDHEKKGWYKDPEECNATLRVLQRSANNVYYPVNQSALTIPPWSNKIHSIFAKDIDKFEIIMDLDDEELITTQLKKYFNKNMEIYGCDEQYFLNEFYKWYNYEPKNIDAKILRNDEYKALSGPDNDEEYFITMSTKVPECFNGLISQIKLVKKLREVMVLQGFRRILPTFEADVDERKRLGLSNNDFSSISKQPLNWLPAIELFGEGIFIKLDEDAIQNWELNNVKRYNSMGFRVEKNLNNNNDMFDKRRPRYVVLHTLAHLLIRQLSAQCGYATASLKEKIYSTYIDGEESMCGILIYTSASDSDGSLGGLVREGYSDKIEDTLKNMLEESTWCSNDPICIESINQGYKGLNYSACHACTLLPETSCEAFNCLLDRASIVGTPDNKDIGYFKDFIWSK